MKSLFFFYLLFLGGVVFSLPAGIYINTLQYSFNASELQTTKLLGTGSIPDYFSLLFEIRELYNQDYQTEDGFRSYIILKSPAVLQKINLPSFTCNPVFGPQFFYTAFRFEPCGLSSNYDFSVIQEIERFPNNLMVKGSIDVITEESLIPGLPYKEQFNSFYQFNNGDFYGNYRYRTVKMTGYSQYYQNKDLMIKLSVPGVPEKSISEFITEVIFASGDQCIWTYDISSEDRFVKQVPQDLEIGSSWNVTVPARDIWYIAFVTKFNSDQLRVEYLLVDRQNEWEPWVDISSAGIPSLDFNLIVVFFLSVLIFQK
jgi:hypothetical protein